jgi:hypothetical protein
MGEEMTDHTLSPDAQAVLDAYRSSHLSINNLAAALRAAADQVVPEHRENYPNTLDERHRKMSVFDIRNRILAIAAKLENNND